MANNLGNLRPTMGTNNYKNSYNNHNNNDHSHHQFRSSQTQNNHHNSITQPNGHHQQQQITGTPLDAPADCTIACDKGHITAHKLILCDHSKYLQDILSKYPTAEHPIIILTELNIIDIKILVNYMYTGELVITSDSSPSSLLRAAQILKIDSLTADDDDDEDEDEDDRRGEEEGENLDEDMVENGNVDLEDYLEDQDDEDVVANSNVDMEDYLEDQEDDDLVETSNIDLEDDLEDQDDDLINQDDDHHHNNNSRLINSIKNIYSISGASHGSSQQQQLQQQQQQFVKLDFSSNPKHNNNHVGFSNNNTPNSLSHHIQQQLNSHLDLQDLQDSKQLDNKNNKIRCHLCNIGLSDVKCLYRHVLTRHLPEKWGYKCEFCDREFSRDDHLMRHYTTKHKNMEFNREKIRETRRLNREMAKNFHDQISTA